MINNRTFADGVQTLSISIIITLIIAVVSGLIIFSCNFSIWILPVTIVLGYYLGLPIFIISALIFEHLYIFLTKKQE